MTSRTIVRIAFDALGGNRLRTGLTMLGMIIGVAAVITMVALGRGAQSAIEAQIRSAGTNVVAVMAGSMNVGGVRQGAGAATTLTADDVEAIRALPGVEYVAASVNTRQQVVASTQNWFTSIQGTDVDFPNIRDWPAGQGRFFTAAEVRSLANVAVLGSIVSASLFGADADPLGQIVRIKGQPFRVVGVLTAKGVAAMGQDQDDAVFIPYTTAQHKLLGVANVQGATVSAATAEDVPRVAAEIGDLLRVRHHLAADAADDFTVRTLEEMTAIRTQSTETMTALLAGIAAVSLLVGGIGIMNIMLVSVTERTREIGLRMAVGAKGRDVLMQFLIEAATISLVGGTCGIGFGYALSRGLTWILSWPTAFAPSAVVMAFAFSALVGIFFGFYPARRAASLDPIEALRYE